MLGFTASAAGVSLGLNTGLWTPVEHTQVCVVLRCLQSIRPVQHCKLSVCGSSTGAVWVGSGLVFPGEAKLKSCSEKCLLWMYSSHVLEFLFFCSRGEAALGPNLIKLVSEACVYIC